MQHLIGHAGALLCLTADGNLCSHQCEPEGQCQNNVYKDKDPAAVLSCQIRKTPQVSQPYRTSGSRKDKSDAPPEKLLRCF